MREQETKHKIKQQWTLNYQSIKPSGLYQKKA